MMRRSTRSSVRDAGTRATQRCCRAARCVAAGCEAVDDLQRSQHRRSLHPRPALRRRHAPHRRRSRPRPARSASVAGLGWHYLGAANLPRQPHEVLVEDHRARGAHPAEPGDRGRARPRRRRPLQAARHRHGRAQRRPRQGQRGVRRLAPRRAVDALRRERRARHHPPDRLRRTSSTTSTSSRRSTRSAPAPPRSAPTSCCSSTASRWS